MLVQDFLTGSAARFPEKVALICDGRHLTYAELDAMSNRLANALIQGGVRRGDRVALHLPNSVEAVVGIFAFAAVIFAAGSGAEKLSGRGDFLLIAGGDRVRLQIAYLAPGDTQEFRNLVLPHPAAMNPPSLLGRFAGTA